MAEQAVQNLLATIRSRTGDLLASAAVFNGQEIRLEAAPGCAHRICLLLAGETGACLAGLLANDERQLPAAAFALYYIFTVQLAGQPAGALIQLKALAGDNGCYESLVDDLPAAAAYEREIADLYGLQAISPSETAAAAAASGNSRRLVFHGNWPDDCFPLRKDFPAGRKPPLIDRADPFLAVAGEGVFEIPVGPVHAGIIEPGHFRFNVAGEPVINLEAQLYFTHRGVEKLAEGMDSQRAFYLAERVSGDETFANSLAYCQAVEQLAGVTVPRRARLTRVVFAELERLTSHLGDLAGVCLDVAYGFAASQFRLMRGWCYLLAEELCGMRFLRSVNTPGGVRRDFTAGKEQSSLARLASIARELEDTIRIIRGNALFSDRVENTGILRLEVAKDLHAVGPAARASGIRRDIRCDLPYAAYDELAVNIAGYNYGDVNCRVNVKLDECRESIRLMQAAIGLLAGCADGGTAPAAGRTADSQAAATAPLAATLGRLPAYQPAIGCVESPRGENIHWLMFGEDNTIYRYKIRTPSFCNWPALCLAVQGNIVPDFPLINKSFNLSYAGNDL